MAYYVSGTGEVLRFRVGEKQTLVLSNGAVIKDPPETGRLFATEKSAMKYAQFLSMLNDPRKADKAHLEWVRKGSP